jgi:hypothetical protein
LISLRKKQSLLVKCLGLLINYAYSKGWELTLADGLRRDEKGHMAGSLHYIGLAQDLNLFIADVFITDGSRPEWKELAEYWESLDPLCSSGYWFQDANHFSIRHGGKR